MEFEHQQLFGSIGGIVFNQASINDVGEDYPIYDPRWNIPEGKGIYCGQCEGLLDDSDLKVGECSHCGFVIPSLRDIAINSDVTQGRYDWLAEDVKSILRKPYLESLKETLREMKRK